MSIGMSPFRELYGYDALTFSDMIFGDSRAPKAKDWVEESQEILKLLKDNLQVAQNQQKQYADKHREERTFQVDDLVYFRLHPYKQTSLKRNGAEKLKPRYYGPYKVIRKIGEVAYELELPEGSKIHNVFHVSCFKKYISQQIVISDTLPHLDDEGQLTLISEKVLKTRERRLRSRTIKEYLVQWKDLPSEDATWEEENVLQNINLKFI